MPKHLSCLVALIMFATSTVSLSTHPFNEDDDSRHYHKPSFKSACMKIFSGVMCYGLFDMAYTNCNKNGYVVGELISGGGLGVGCHLIVDGLYEAMHWGYHQVKANRYRKANANKMLHRERSRMKDLRPRMVHQKDELFWNKSTNVARSVTNLFFSLTLVATSLEHEYSFYNQGISPFSFGIADPKDKSLWLSLPIFTTSTLCLGIISAGYNMNEVFHSSNQKSLRQGDSPVMGLIAGLSENVLASRMPQQYLVTLIDNKTGQLHKLLIGKWYGPYLGDFLNFHGQHQLMASGWQVLKNIGHVKGYAPVSVEHVSLPQESVSKQHKPKEKTNRETKYYTPVYQEETMNFDLKQPEKEVYLEPEKKAKRTGTADLTLMKKPLDWTASSAKDTKASSATPIAPDNERNEALREVNELRAFNAIAERTINRLLKQVCKFTTGTIKNIDGSECAIVFQRGTQKISIKFETPHAKDSANYTGFKLKTVLSAIETAYMYNWDEQSILNYMNTQGIHRFYSIPKNLLYILWNRPDL